MAVRGTGNLNLASLLFNGDAREQWLAYLAAYCDAGGTHESSPFITLAGYISTEDRWRAFKKEWLIVLRSNNLPFFHMTDFENRQGLYRPWKDRQRHHVIKSLCGIIKRHTIGSFATSISRPHYEHLDAASQKLLGTAAFVCSDYSIWSIVRRLEEGHRPSLLVGNSRDVKVAYIFEKATPGYGELSEKFRTEDDWRSSRKIHSLSIVTKLESPEVQAADIIAYESGKQVLRHTGLDSRPMRKSVQSLLKSGSHEGTVFATEDHVRSIVEALSPSPTPLG